MADRRTVIAAARVSPTELARPITDLPHLPAQSADAFLHLLMQGAKTHEEQAGEGGSPAFEGIRNPLFLWTPVLYQLTVHWNRGR